MRSRVLSSLITIILLMTLLVACSNQNIKKTPQENKIKKVGIIQIVEHPALDDAREGFIKVLEEAGYKEGENISYDYQNAQGDMSTAQTIAKQFAYDDLDLILAIATPTAQAVANSVKDTPILITAVTDPKSAGLVESIEKPGANITGTSDLTPVKEQFKLLIKIVPQAKKVGIIYNAGETNSVVQAELAESAAKELGLELIPATVSSSNEVYQSAQSLVGRVDAIYVPTDNTVVSAIQSVVKVTNKSNLPLIVGEDNSVENGGLATVGINYYNLGKQTGKMAIKIFNGAKPAEMPIQYLENTDLVINLKAAEKMNVEIKEDLLSQAKKVIK
ncbi:ABC transporter substrate-binding protein [Orenia marismortui]|uniref:ABC transporter substrate-binding protein n=1 Tax=Orenia marismortui TaxID=46469 RepID=UPI00036778F9|nr:ABC transporter substrate-binding protein [Orenia marismortui]